MKKIYPYMDRIQAIDAIQEKWPLMNGDMLNTNTLTDQILTLVNAGVDPDRISIKKREGRETASLHIKDREYLISAIKSVVGRMKKLNTDIFYLTTNTEKFYTPADSEENKKQIKEKNQEGNELIHAVGILSDLAVREANNIPSTLSQGEKDDIDSQIGLSL